MKRYEELVERMKTYKSVLVSFSGGVDSTFLAKACFDALKDKALAITINAPYIQKQEIRDAINMAKQIGIRHLVLNKDFNKELLNNPDERCYICKKNIMWDLKHYSYEEDFEVVVEGSNYDDTKEHRPGRKALKELDILSPMVEMKLSKYEIRMLSKKLKLPTWNKPSTPCLLTRLPHNKKVIKEHLALVERAEKYLFAKGYKENRVRIDTLNAKIEMPYELRIRFMNDLKFKQMLEDIKSFGFKEVLLDFQKFRSENR